MAGAFSGELWTIATSVASSPRHLARLWTFGRQIKLNSSKRGIFLNDTRGARYQDVVKLDPPCPRADATHRYVEVPVSYRHPAWSTFRLYYEVNSDFDVGRPTVMIPADGQVASSWVGKADQFKKRWGFRNNVVIYQLRGTHCSSIPGPRRGLHMHSGGRVDWRRAFHIFHSDNIIEDMDRVRQDLLGAQGKLRLFGGSGIAIIGLKYLARYHRHVTRAYLISLDPRQQHP